MLSRNVSEDGKVWYVVEDRSLSRNFQAVEEDQAVEFLEREVRDSDENGVANESDLEESPAGEQSTSTALPTKRKRIKNTGRWSNEAIWKLLDVIEKNPVDLDQVSYQQRVDYWAQVAAEMADGPSQHTPNECCFKYRSMRMSYKKLKQIHSVTERPVHWPFFNKMGQILGDDESISIPTIPPLPADHPTFSEAKFPKQKTKQPVSKDQAGLTMFEELLKRKKEALDEVKHHGIILKKYIEETSAASVRRENRETEMLEVLLAMRAQEEKKLQLFQKLLDKL